MSSQKILGFPDTSAIFPLPHLTSNAKVMGEFADSLMTRMIARTVFGLISVGNLWLIFILIT